MTAVMYGASKACLVLLFPSPRTWKICLQTGLNSRIEALPIPLVRSDSPLANLVKASNINRTICSPQACKSTLDTFWKINHS
jgi:hypothetical protein